MKVVFNEANHTYWLGERQLISVTQLLKKHGLSPDYGVVSPEVLQAKAERGTQIHKEIECYIKNGEAGFTRELLDYIDIAEELKLVPEDSEIILPCGEISEEEADKHNVAGTADLIAYTNGALSLLDIKTSAKLDKRACAWQLSLYERLAGVEFAKLYIIHLCDDSKVVEIERIPAAEIDRLLECERNGETYKEVGIIVSADLVARAQQAEATLKEAEAAKAAAEATAKEYRQMLYEAMGQQGIASWESLDKSMLITRVEPTTKTSIDSTKLKKEQPDVYAKYTKTSEVKGYVRITLREV